MPALFGLFMGPPGVWELLIVALIVLLLFGGRLPNVMRNLGRGVVEFKKGIQGVEEDIENAAKGDVDKDKEE
jgi:sec-independent protein translocase protein TatA